MPRLHIEYTAQTADGVAPTPADMAKIASVLRARIDAMGVADPTVATHDLVVVVELPGVIDPADGLHVDLLLGHTGKVDFVPLGETTAAEGDPIDLTTHPPLFGGDQIASAKVATDQNGGPAVDFVLKPDGTRLFADYTATHVGSYFAITIDGVVLTAPVIQNAIPNGDIEITGGGPDGFDAISVNGLVGLIGSGELPVPLAITSSVVLGVPSVEPRSPSRSRARPDPGVGPSPSRDDHPPTALELDGALLRDGASEPESASRCRPAAVEAGRSRARRRVARATARERRRKRSPTERNRPGSRVDVVDRQLEDLQCHRPADGRPPRHGRRGRPASTRRWRSCSIRNGGSDGPSAAVRPAASGRRLHRRVAVRRRSGRRGRSRVCAEPGQVGLERVGRDRPRREPSAGVERAQRRRTHP